MVCAVWGGDRAFLVAPRRAIRVAVELKVGYSRVVRERAPSAAPGGRAGEAGILVMKRTSVCPLARSHCVSLRARVALVALFPATNLRAPWARRRRLPPWGRARIAGCRARELGHCNERARPVCLFISGPHTVLFATYRVYTRSR